jgi:hypothetical protein
MELLNVKQARSIWLFDIDELNPQGKSIQPELVEWLKDNYHFEKFPKSLSALSENKGVAFEEGSYQLRDEFFISVNLTLYNDGVVADTMSSTEDTDKFIDDALNLAVKDFGLHYTSHLVRQKLYVSELYVQCGRSLGGLNKGLKSFSDRLSSLSSSTKASFDVSSIGFWADPSASPVQTGPFQFERKAGTAFSENRFYSRAPLPTKDHLALLDDFEHLLVG